MYRDVNMWTEIRRLVLTGQKSKRAVCEAYEIHWKTLEKILAHEEPPGYRMKKPRTKPKLGRFLPIIREILKQDRKAPKKQQHTAKRIFERLRDEYGYEGKLTVVKDAVRAWKRTRAEVFMPLSHRPSEAQADFGEARVVLRGEPTKVAYFVMSLPYSDAFFCQVFPRECTETFQEGHRRDWGREQVSFDPLHYLALLERKPGALDFARPLENWSLPECFWTLRRRMEAAIEKDATREFIKVLRLLESFRLKELTAAVERTLEIGATTPSV